MPQTTSLDHPDSRKTNDAYAQLGLEPGASIREIEAAYWWFARELRGQPSLAPYTAAYEALVSRVSPRRTDVQPAPSALATPPAVPPRKSALVSKFGWPAN